MKSLYYRVDMASKKQLIKMYVFGVIAPLFIFTLLAIIAPSKAIENFMIVTGSGIIAALSAGMFLARNKFVAKSYLMTFFFWVVIPGAFAFNVMSGFMVSFSSASYKSETLVVFGCLATILGLVITYLIYVFQKQKMKK
ncbi:MAG: hypothetical protein HUJ25_11590 [Crocinitomicaceae bacterium]|nr:hypothetical protein [Crocinitomicaceae bacterium]